MHNTFERSVDVNVPIAVVYDQWTQFESFPIFMIGVESITRDGTQTHWTTNLGGILREFDAQITQQHPNELVAWQAVTGPTHAGMVTFDSLAPEFTRVHLEMAYKPEGDNDSLSLVTGVAGGQIEADLGRFKRFIETREAEAEVGGPIDPAA